MEGLEDLVVELILSKVDPTDAASFACVNRRFRVWASDDNLWRRFCFLDLDLKSPIDPLGSPCPSFKITYKVWHESFGMYPWSLVKRTKRCWAVIETWLATNFPEVRNTLRKGASEREIKEAEEKLGVRLPPPTRLLYRFHDGQDLKFLETEDAAILGLIGGYCFYGQVANVYLLPLAQVVLDTKNFVEHRFASQSKCVIVASSFYDRKLFFLNCRSGHLYVGTRNLFVDGDMIPCVPQLLVKCEGVEAHDAMLLWLEEHGRRLRDGVIGIREEWDLRIICQFPETPPACSTAVTNGVQVRASAVFVPEKSGPKDEIDDKYCFAYSIRMSLLSDGLILDGMYHSSCQLQSRHWIIRAGDAVIGDLKGEAVIGKYPLLAPNKGEFVYQSCSRMPSLTGSIEGSFTFVPGRIMSPKGRLFEVEVASFPLEVPGYIF
ncbi:F-box protein SKIP16 [Acorus gramineus]|uniref:F-box protein SKIP16 n=1 Tax=Acorus gramineus TaxID=55184 RepID=A0AAV9B1H5_ACOGR|nr:F-box protein SKIP16 [Acorus gramineus]